MLSQEIKDVKNEFNNFFNNLIKRYSKDIRYMVNYINIDENLIKKTY